MIITKIHQGKYYTTITRLLESHKRGEVVIEETNGLKLYKTINGSLIYCQQQEVHNNELILLLSFK